MKNSSARQLEFDYTNAPTGPQPMAAASGAVVSSATAQFLNFTRYDETFVADSKLAGRINAASVSDVELDDLLRERKKLINKKLMGQISRRESNRLEYVRWTLDRIEDARDGYILEALENSVVRYERLTHDLQQLYETLGAQLPRKRKRRPR